MQDIKGFLMVDLVGLCFATFAKPESRERVNQETVSIVDCSLTSTYSQLVWDMASLFDDGYDLRVAPIARVSGAPTRYLTVISKDEALHLLDIPLVGAPYKETTLNILA